jgi:hypothetical protein
MMDNTWTVTDDDCFQVCKPLGDSRYAFMQIVELPTGYQIASSVICTEDYSKPYRLDLISLYGYSESFFEENEDADQLLAEMTFETEALEFLNGVTYEDWNAAQEAIQAKMDAWKEQ